MILPVQIFLASRDLQYDFPKIVSLRSPVITYVSRTIITFLFEIYVFFLNFNNKKASVWFVRVWDSLMSLSLMRMLLPAQILSNANV